MYVSYPTSKTQIIKDSHSSTASYTIRSCCSYTYGGYCYHTFLLSYILQRSIIHMFKHILLRIIKDETRSHPKMHCRTIIPDINHNECVNIPGIDSSTLVSYLLCLCCLPLRVFLQGLLIVTLFCCASS